MGSTLIDRQDKAIRTRHRPKKPSTVDGQISELASEMAALYTTNAQATTIADTEAAAAVATHVALADPHTQYELDAHKDIGGGYLGADANARLTSTRLSMAATDRLLGRSTAGAGASEEIVCTAAGRALIDDADIAAQRTTLGLGALAVLAQVDTAQIVAKAVSYAKMQDVSATDKLLGRSTAGAGSPEEIACTAAARSILDDATVAAILNTLGVARAQASAPVALSAAATINVPALDVTVAAGETWVLDYYIPVTVSGGTVGLKPIFTLPASSSGNMDCEGNTTAVTATTYARSTTPGTALATPFITASFTGFIRVRAVLTFTNAGTCRFGLATGASAAGNILAGASVMATRL